MNDISTGTPQATFESAWESMLDKCVANDIIPVVISMFPWTNGSTVQMQTRDTFKAALETICDDYQTSIHIDFDDLIGEFRVGGDVDNLWDIQAAYDADGVHLNKAGYTAVAERIRKYLPF